MQNLKRMAHWTGLGYLLIFITAFFATGFVVEAMVIPGDPAGTWANFKAAPGMLSLAILSFVLMVLIDAILAVPFYLLLRSVNQSLAMISSALRLVNAAVFAVALMDLVSFLRLLGKPYSGDELFILRQVDHLTQSFDDTWLLGLIFFGVHLMIMGYLILKSPRFPSWIGLMIQLAGLVYVIDSVASFSLTNYNDYSGFFEIMVVIPSVIGELSLCLWLLIRGIRIQK
tara:strand:+ start:602 stop:1285 length:684 start_codon:yes stop_codon:yes gene_type:complete